MAGLGPATHVFIEDAKGQKEGADARAKPGQGE